MECEPQIMHEEGAVLVLVRGSFLSKADASQTILKRILPSTHAVASSR